ncbi:MAG TPA: TonB family protein [Thermoanaerobaculia bacterium]|nr:TonB family protein [Thermoanaerobaculia bacterium]
MQERIDLVVVAEEKRKAGGLSLSVIVSLVAHAALLIWFLTSYKPAAAPAEAPMTRYVELMRQNPQEFTEAPGPAVAKAPINAPLSDRNRKASMPEPTGTTPTKRPGDGSGGLYTPPAGNPAPRSPRPSSGAPAMQTPRQNAPQQPTAPAQTPALTDSSFIYREPAKASAAAAGMVDWKNAIREAGKAAAGGAGGDGIDLARMGGEQGFAEQGPLSFETQWYDWGDYAQSMVSKIRVNWYANMPQIIRTGMKGVVTIRFTIHRDGRISDITILNSSGVPPYDAAARKAIELSSPLKQLPADFPNPTERVTCMFYYNVEIPQA